MRKTQGRCTFQALLLWEKSVNLCSPILFGLKPDGKRCFNSIPGPKKEPILKMDKSKYCKLQEQGAVLCSLLVRHV